MKTIAIITARGGSKRIPKKNIKEFCGKPIMAYSIEAALSSGVFDEVMVSTDSEEIATIAREYGAAVPFMRSPETSNDFATTADVIKEVIQSYKEKNIEFEYLCCIYPTAPFVTARKLQESMQKLLSAEADSLMPVVQFSFPPQRGMIEKNGILQYQYPEFSKMRSQDLPTIYHDCGQYYFCKTTSFIQYNSVVTPNTIPDVMPEEEVQDIDNESDWMIAEIKYRTFILGKEE